MSKRIMVTGGAGFIGSNLVAALIDDPRVSLVRVVDDLSTGRYDNIAKFEGHTKFEFFERDICDYPTMLELTKGIDLITHQAALGSVPRSIKDPIRSNEVNVTGTLNVLFAAVQNNVNRIVLACSSSTYGDSPALPKKEAVIGRPLSPYAITKFAVELYADVFQKTYSLDYVGLRYFNIFGPNQSPDNAYAAVIPLFCKALIEDRAPKINGDGLTSRDFTYVDNAVHANLLALFTDKKEALNEVYNVACGEQTTLLEMVEALKRISGKQIDPEFGPERMGDVKHSRADISKIQSLLGYQPQVLFSEGLQEIYHWYATRMQVHG
ncbi:SDR family oxidoreductase [Pseudochryseolinea flava]|uniref:LPS biosynthesis protein WbpP n=1 Tax=Pseudochryseolinea flava TaxID=2059302 RepID=A0A364Y3L2_9BACT|nr:SDR family oxidoreductase [Pseudochryseolinea flava]RAW01309.1 LPS biosynthesis protein WbpP [Pseudochryseolinea flava]